LNCGHGNCPEELGSLRICPAKLLAGPRWVVGDDLLEAVGRDLPKERGALEDFILPLLPDLSPRSIFFLELQILRIEAQLGLLVFFKHG